MTIKMNNYFKQQKVRETSGILLHCIYISSVSQYKNISSESIQNCIQQSCFPPLTALKLVQNVNYKNDQFVNAGYYNIII